MTTDGYRNENVSQQRQQHRGGDPSRIETLLHSLIDRLEETDTRYAAALGDLESRLNDLSARTDTAGAGDSQAAAEALDRVGSQAAALAEQVREAERAQRARDAQEADDTFRAIENRIGEFATRLQHGGEAASGATRQQPAESAPGGAPEEPPDAGFGQRFADVAADFEQSLAAGHATAELDDLKASVDELARRFDTPPESRNDAATLRSIEEQLNDLCTQFAEARQHYNRVDTIENHLVHLLERTQTSDSRVEAAARKAAQETAQHMQPDTGGVNDRLDAVHRELRALNERAQAMDGRTADTLESMNDALHSLSNQLAASGPAAPGAPVYAGNEPSPPHRAASGSQPEHDPIAAAPQPERDPLATGPQPERNIFAPEEPADDFLASARRAAQAAATQPEAGERKKSLLSRLGRKKTPPPEPPDDAGNRNESRSSRPLLVMAVLFLLVASTALIYGRLTNDADPAATAPPGASAPSPASDPQSPRNDPAESSAGDGGNGINAGKAQPQSSPGPRAGALRAPLVAETDADSGERQTAEAAKDEAAGTETASVPELPVDPGIPGIAVRINQAGGSGADETPGETGSADADSAPPPVPWAPQKNRARPKPASHKPDTAGSQTQSQSQSQTQSPSRNAAMPPAALGPQSLRLAAARGNAQAQHEIGVRYAGGDGVKPDDKKAAQWYARAAAQGLAPAQYRLAVLYERGQGVKQDAALARVWYERAAEQGNIKAMHNLAVMLTSDEDRKADYEAAAKWFTEAARHGLADSQFNLGILYEAGLGVKKSPENAYRWFSLAARRGDEQAEKRKQRVRRQLRREQIRNADRSLRQWRPKPSDKAANEVRPPEGGWKEAATGSAGENVLVTKAQKLLNELGYDAGVPDGRYGPRTRAAVRRFEERNGLELTGEVTSDLVSRLEARAS